MMIEFNITFITRVQYVLRFDNVLQILLEQ